MPIGPLELIIVLVIVLVLFGARRLPEVGRGLGTGIREFKDSVTGKDRPELEDGAGQTPEASGAPPAETQAEAAERTPAGPPSA